MTTVRLDLTREQIVTFRRTVNGLVERLPSGPPSLRQAAWAGLQDSMPRAAVVSIHARVRDARPDTWEDRSLAQLWGPHFSAYVVARRDVAVFSIGRLPDDGRRRRVAEDLAHRLHAFLDGRTMTYSEAGRGLGEDPNQLRYAAMTGTLLIRWDGARQPTIWTVPTPDVEPIDARLELARRYWHIFGPSTPAAFGRWAGILPVVAGSAFDALVGSLTPVNTPVGDAWILAEDEPIFRAAAGPTGSTRLLPSGDAYFLLHGAEREILVPHAEHRKRLWTSRVWPGAVLVDGEIVGTWRRAQANVTIESWRRLSPTQRASVEAEAASLPLPGTDGPVRVRWDI